MPSVDPVIPMTAMVVILPRPAERREPGSPTLDLECRERTGWRAQAAAGRLPREVRSRTHKRSFLHASV
jgi:hypothetical protein